MVNRKGENSPHWKGGRKLQAGYWHLLMPEYFSSYSNGYVREHVYIFQEHYKCCMLPWGDIHHLNEIKTDNRILNMIGILKSKHRRLHMLGNMLRRIDMNDRICSQCGSKETWIRTGKYPRPAWYSNDKGILCSKCFSKNYRDRKKLKDDKHRGI